MPTKLYSSTHHRSGAASSKVGGAVTIEVAMYAAKDRAWRYRRDKREHAAAAREALAKSKITLATVKWKGEVP